MLALDPLQTTLRALFLMAVCAAGTASAADLRHQVEFAKPPMMIVTCAVAPVMKAHPEMYWEPGAGEKSFSMSAAPTKLAALYWKLTALDAGSGKSTVTLEGSGATPAELDEVWRFVEACGNAEP